jgi:hypothetical protein
MSPTNGIAGPVATAPLEPHSATSARTDDVGSDRKIKKAAGKKEKRHWLHGGAHRTANKVSLVAPQATPGDAGPSHATEAAHPVKYTLHIRMRPPGIPKPDPQPVRPQRQEPAVVAADPGVTPLEVGQQLPDKVVATLNGSKWSVRGAEFLKDFGLQQNALFRTQLVSLIEALTRYADPLVPHGLDIVPLVKTAEEATQAWLLADYRSYAGPSADTWERSFDQTLRGLPEEDLLSLYAGIVAARSYFSPRTNEHHHVTQVGLRAAKEVWAEDLICFKVGRPKSPGQVREMLLEGARQGGKSVLAWSIDMAADGLQKGVVDGYRERLATELLARARAELDARGIPVNALVPITGNGPPDVYAREVGQALRDMRDWKDFDDDVQYRKVLNAAIDGFSESQLSTAYDRLLKTSVDEASQQMTFMMDDVVQPFDKACTQRRFRILLDVLGDRYMRENEGGPRPPALALVKAWEWDPCLSELQVPKPGRLSRMWAPIQRMLDRAGAEDPNDARRQIGDAALAFVGVAAHYARPGKGDGVFVEAENPTTSRGADRARHTDAASTRAFDASVMRLVKTMENYQAICTGLGGPACKQLGLATDQIAVSEQVFREALRKVPGPDVDALGAQLHTDRWKDVLDGRLGARIAPVTRWEAGWNKAKARVRRFVDIVTFRRSSPRVAVLAATAGAPSKEGTKDLMYRLQAVVEEERVVRASMSILRAVDRYFADPRNAGAAYTQPEGSDRLAALQSDVWPLERRFRPLVANGLLSSEWKLDRFIEEGMKRLGAAERQRLDDAVHDTDRTWPDDPVLMAVVHYFQRHPVH